MIDLLLNVRQPGKIANLSLDATLNESHDYQNEVTQFPIESGANISDHVRSAPERVTITGFVTNSPIPSSLFDLQAYGAAFQSSTLGKTTKQTTKTRVLAALEELMRVAGYAFSLSDNAPVTPERQKVIIVTGLRVYTDMVLARLTIPRDNGTGDAITFTAEFVKILTVKPEIVSLPKVSDKKPAAHGVKQQTAKVPQGKTTAQTIAPTSKKSIAASGFDALVNVF